MTERQLAKELLEVIPPLVRLIRAEIRGSAPSVLSVPQFRVLNNIRRGLNTVSGIAEHHGVSQPAMTKMVNGLVARGLVRRRPHPGDSRQTLLLLTAKGRALHARTWAEAQRRLARHLKAVPAADRAPILRALGALRDVVLPAR